LGACGFPTAPFFLEIGSTWFSGESTQRCLRCLGICYFQLSSSVTFDRLECLLNPSQSILFEARDIQADAHSLLGDNSVVAIAWVLFGNFWGRLESPTLLFVLMSSTWFLCGFNPRPSIIFGHLIFEAVQFLCHWIDLNVSRSQSILFRARGIYADSHISAMARLEDSLGICTRQSSLFG
jgi:hypothetical protein